MDTERTDDLTAEEIEDLIWSGAAAMLEAFEAAEGEEEAA